MKLQFNLKSNVGHEKICAISYLHWSRKKSRNWSRLNEKKSRYNVFEVKLLYCTATLSQRLNWITSMTFITMVN